MPPGVPTVCSAVVTMTHAEPEELDQLLPVPAADERAAFRGSVRAIGLFVAVSIAFVFALLSHGRMPTLPTVGYNHGVGTVEKYQVKGSISERVMDSQIKIMHFGIDSEECKCSDSGESPLTPVCCCCEGRCCCSTSEAVAKSGQCHAGFATDGGHEERSHATNCETRVWSNGDCAPPHASKVCPAFCRLEDGHGCCFEASEPGALAHARDHGMSAHCIAIDRYPADEEQMQTMLGSDLLREVIIGYSPAGREAKKMLEPLPPGAEVDFSRVEPTDLDRLAHSFAVDLPSTFTRLAVNATNRWTASDESAGEVVGRLGGPANLEVLELDFRGSDIGDSDVQSLTNMYGIAREARHKAIRLNLMASAIGDPGLRKLLLSLPQSLVSLVLDLDDTDVGFAHVLHNDTVMPSNLLYLSYSLKRTKMGNGGLVALAKALPASLSVLDLDLSFTQVGDVGLGNLTAALPSSLISLSLRLSFTAVSQAGIRYLCEHLPSSLASLRVDAVSAAESDGAIAASFPESITALRLDLRGKDNVGLGDVGLVSMARALPARLGLLDLNLANTEVSNSGFGALTDALPTTLRVLGVSLVDSRVDSFGSKALPSGLHSLSLNFGDTGLGDEGLQNLNGSLPQRLTSLSVSLWRTEIHDAGFRHFAAKLPSSLTSLSLYLQSTEVGDSALEGLASALPRGITSLDMALFDTRVGDQGVRKLAQALPGTLTSLSLALGFTSVGDEGIRALALSLPANLSSIDLDLRLGQLGDGGIQDLAEALPPGIVSISFDLRKTNITEVGLEHLARALNADHPHRPCIKYQSCMVLVSGGQWEQDVALDRSWMPMGQ